MPLVEKTTGASVYLRGLERNLAIGDRADVSEDYAAYLCDERGDFERLEVQEAEFREVDDEDEAEDDEGAEATDEPSLEDQIDAGDCPWCDEYEGDGVPQHASAAHPEEWDAYKED